MTCLVVRPSIPPLILAHMLARSGDIGHSGSVLLVVLCACPGCCCVCLFCVPVCVPMLSFFALPCLQCLDLLCLGLTLPH